MLTTKSQIKIKTSVLQDAVSKAVKGAGNLPILAITTAIGIEVTPQGSLILTTTSNTVNLKITVPNVTSPQEVGFYACTECDLFAKLTSKTTSEFVTLILTDSALVFVGNGQYTLPIIADEEGSVVRIQDIVVNSDSNYEITKRDIDKILRYNKGSVAKTYETPVYAGYCIQSSDKHEKSIAVTYNTNTACISNIAWKGSDLLLPRVIVDLMSLISSEKATYACDGVNIIIKGGDVEISGAVQEGLESYPVDSLAQLVNSNEFTSFVKISKPVLSSIIDRMSLFVTDIEMNSINIGISAEGMTVSSHNMAGCEQVQLMEKDIKEPMTKIVVLNDLKTVVDTLVGDTVTIKFGSDKGLNILENNVNQLVPFISDEEESDEGIDEEIEDEYVDDSSDTDSAPFDEE